jgi:hypothetical protein
MFGIRASGKLNALTPSAHPIQGVVLEVTGDRSAALLLNLGKICHGSLLAELPLLQNILNVFKNDQLVPMEELGELAAESQTVFPTRRPSMRVCLSSVWMRMISPG